MKKALQITLLRAKYSLPEGVVVGSPREARSGSPGDQFAQLRIADRRGCLGPCAALLRPGSGRARPRRRIGRRGLRYRPRSEAESSRRRAAEHAAKTFEHLWCE